MKSLESANIANEHVRSTNESSSPLKAEVISLTSAAATAVAYLRVSTDGQSTEDRFGLKAQRAAIEQYAEQNNLLIKHYFEETVSGASDEREVFDSILYNEREILDGVSKLLVFKNDRIARDINLYFYYKMLLHKQDIELISVNEDFDSFGTFAPILEAFIMFAAEAERQNIVKRTVAGKREKVKMGGWNGGQAPLGYRAENQELIIDEREAELIREIFRLYFLGESRTNIARILKKNKMKGRRAYLHTGGISGIINRAPIYYGWIKYGDSEWYKGIHEPIFTDKKDWNPNTDPLIPEDEYKELRKQREVYYLQKKIDALKAE